MNLNQIEVDDITYFQTKLEISLDRDYQLKNVPALEACQRPVKQLALLIATTILSH